jgi:DNA polymerase delta subunit 3
MTKRWTKIQKVSPKPKSRWLGKQTSKVRKFLFARMSIRTYALPIPFIHSLKGAIHTHTLCSYLQSFPFTHSRKHHCCPHLSNITHSIQEPALLCEPAKSFRDSGNSIAAGFTVALGRITGLDIKVRIFAPSLTRILTMTVFVPQKRTDLQQRRSSTNAKSSTTASTSKNKLPGLSKAPSMTEDAKPVIKSEPKDVKSAIKEEPVKPAKPSGKLDFFSKAKVKPPVPAAPPKPAPETRKIKVEPIEEPPPEASFKAALKVEPKPSRSKVSDSEGDESATARTRVKPSSTSKRVESTKSAARVRKGVVISDDDEDEEAPKAPPRTKAAYKSKAKAKTKDTSPDDPDGEKELRAMMDIDDGKKKKSLRPFFFCILKCVTSRPDQVTRVSRTASVSESATSPPATDVEMEDREPEPEPEPVRAPTRKTQRKPKKEVPVGRNGLKKKRVVKSRMTTDDKGYFGASSSSSHPQYAR